MDDCVVCLHGPSAARGFGLIDVALGILASITLMTGSILAFQTVGANRDLSEAARTVATLSFELRNASRRLERFSSLPGLSAGDIVAIDIANYTPTQHSSLHLSAIAPTSGPDQFEIHVIALSDTGCRRMMRDPAMLGYGVAEVRCVPGDEGAGWSRLEVTFGR